MSNYDPSAFRGVLTLHYLVMYHNAEGENNDVQAYAKTHKKALSEWFASQTKGMKWRSPKGRNLDIELNLVILTEADIPVMKEVHLPIRPTRAKYRTMNIDEYSKAVENYEVEKKNITPDYNKYMAHERMFKSISGFFQHINLTKNTKIKYCLSLVPVDDPKWNNVTHLELLAHEVLGHGMGSADEYNNAESFPFYDIYKKETGNAPEGDSLMYAENPKFKGKLRWYPRYLMPAMHRTSNMPYSGNNSLLIDFIRSSMNEIHDLGDLGDPVYKFAPEYQHEQLLKIIGR